jgi:hypothetical protein
MSRIRRAKEEIPKYDTFVGDAPRLSKDRSRCHPRKGAEQRAVTDPGIFLADLKLKPEFERRMDAYKDKDSAFVVKAAWQIIQFLDKWVTEEITNEVLHYYVYFPNPCQSRLSFIDTVMGRLLTELGWDRQSIAYSLKDLYGKARRQAKKTDDIYFRLRTLEWYN